MYLLRTETFAKVFFLLSCASLLLYAMLAFYTFHIAYSNLTHMMSNQDNSLPKYTDNKRIVDNFKNDLFYILIWTVFNSTAVDFEEGQNLLLDQQCSHTNCYITSNKNYLNGDYKQFDAIVFNVSSVVNWNVDLPRNRSQYQKYVFHSMESSFNQAVCPVYTDTYFNLTWTYKLDSDIINPVFEVRDLEGNLIAPKENVKWDSSLHNLTDNELRHLNRKRKTMIWIVDKCETSNDRLQFAKQLQSLFRKNFLDFDIFGCGMFECPENICYRIIERNYYFYFVPEDSDATDYVTKDVLKAYNNYAVPIVMGGADYKRFLPEGSYININSKSNDDIVALVEYIINNPSVYQSYHRWRKIYSIREVKPYIGFCELCSKLNDWKGIRIKSNLRSWWHHGSLHNHCLPGGAESFAEVFSYVNTSRHRLN